MDFGIRQGMAMAWLLSIVTTSSMWEIKSLKAAVAEIWNGYVHIPNFISTKSRKKLVEPTGTEPPNHDLIARVYNEHFEERIKDKLDDVPCYLVHRGTGAEEWELEIIKLTRLVVKAVLEEGEDVDAKIHCPHPSGCKEFEDEEYCGCSPLYLAVKWGEPELVKFALERGADTNTTCGSDTPLIMVSNSWDVIRLTIDNETDINTIRDAEDETLVHKWARHEITAESGSIEDMLEYLLMRGVDINIKNSAGDTALLITADDIPNDWSYDGTYENEFREGKNILARGLLKYGADVDARNEKNWTALHIATHNCNTGLVRMLLEAGADVNIKTGDGSTPLHIAVYRKELQFDDVISWMTAEENREYSKQISTQDFHYDRASLFCANLTMPRLLIEAGADLDAKRDDDWTPLHLAVYYMDFELAKLLLERGASINVKDGLGCTPLHLAVMRSEDISTLLVKNKAKVNTKQANGWTPLHLAVFYQNMDTAMMLIQNGADVNAKQNQGWTPWMIANRMDRIEMAEMLEYYGAEKKVVSLIQNSVRRWWESVSGVWEPKEMETDSLTEMLLYDGLIGLWKCKTSYSELFDI